MADSLAEARVEAVAVALVVLQTPLGDLAEEAVPGIQAIADAVARLPSDDRGWADMDRWVESVEDAAQAAENRAYVASSRPAFNVANALLWAAGVFRSDAGVESASVGNELHGVRRAGWAVESLERAAKTAAIGADVWDATWRDALEHARRALV